MNRFLAFSPNGQLFGTVLDGGADDVLISVDLATGQATVIGRIGFPAVWGLAFAPDGTLFGAINGNPPSLLVIDTTTGVGTAVGTISNANGITGLTYALVSRIPQGKAPNLIVLVHGCCTDENGVKEWDELGNKIAKKIIENQTPEPWEIVVRDWHKDTSAGLDQIGDAHRKAELQAADLNIAISSYTYKYIHMITHSAGARLIDMTAKNLVDLYNNVPSIKDKPFIHLTFLDAYQPNNDDYGKLKDYPEDKHYAEHYVDRTVSIIGPYTNSCLLDAFNFDITGWGHTPEEGKDFGHQWPRWWYKNSVTQGFKYGYRLSFEGEGGPTITELANKYPKGKQCALKDKKTKCKRAPCW